jgi:hypothetical protein
MRPASGRAARRVAAAEFPMPGFTSRPTGPGVAGDADYTLTHLFRESIGG